MSTNKEKKKGGAFDRDFPSFDVESLSKAYTESLNNVTFGGKKLSETESAEKPSTPHDEIVEKIREKKPQIPALSQDAFTLSEETKRIEFISLPLTETVPVYTLKEQYASSVHEETDLLQSLPHMEGTTVRHFVNEDAPCDETILLFIDSFLQDNGQYFAYRYKEVYMVSRQNYERLQEYVETLQPTVVVYENAERAFVDDLYAYVNLANIEYP